jgi:hypothetical protein
MRLTPENRSKTGGNHPVAGGKAPRWKPGQSGNEGAQWKPGQSGIRVADPRQLRYHRPAERYWPSPFPAIPKAGRTRRSYRNGFRRRMKMSSDRLPQPDDFPIGSPESRAAARARLDGQDRQLRRVKVMSHIPRPWPGPGPEPADWGEVPEVGAITQT